MSRPRVSIITSCYRPGAFLETFLHAVRAQTLLDQSELVFVHNEPSASELALLREFDADRPGCLRHLIVDAVEPLGASWNRGLETATGEYACLWNVDDVRTERSIEVQASALDRTPGALLAYGDFTMVAEPGSRDGIVHHQPDSGVEGHLRSYQCGPFPMWRVSVHERVGAFDEQLRSGADYDLVCRIALAGPTLRLPEVLGFFTNVGEGLSTRGDLADVENQVVRMRYGLFDDVDTRFLCRALRYRLRSVLRAGEWSDIRCYVADYRRLFGGWPKRVALGLKRNFVRRYPRLAKSIVRIKRGRRPFGSAGS